ncbi:hypothetical protein AAVH_17574 [Aphelenchoides avenae]|nr:hypothetical protein AAVH_17574 [Aphelenchus avenae]
MLEKVLSDTTPWFVNTRLSLELWKECEALNIDLALKMATTLTGEQCEEGLSEDGSMEQE